MADQKYVFIAGLHRSGTSLLHRCLRDHPEISGFSGTGVPKDEGQHLQSIFPPAKKHGGPGKFGFDARSFLDETSPLVTDENKSRLLREWEAHWDQERAYRLEKSPPTLVRTRFFQALFPDSYFIVLMRHPLAVSYATKKWSRTSLLHNLLDHWLVCHRRFEEDRKHLRRVHVLRYEDFVANPRETLTHIYDFLGLTAGPLEQEVRSRVNDKYFQQWESLEDGLLTRRYAKWVKQRFEPQLYPFAYSLDRRDYLLQPVQSGLAF